MPLQPRKNQARLKIYIPNDKYNEWIDHLEINYPISDFFFNFSRWVRESISKIPDKGVYPIFPDQKNPINRKKSKKIEKTIWISKVHKQALLQKKGFLTLNAFILLILDLAVYGSATENQRIFQILRLQERIDNLEKRILNLIDKTNIKLVQ